MSKATISKTIICPACDGTTFIISLRDDGSERDGGAFCTACRDGKLKINLYAVALLLTNKSEDLVPILCTHIPDVSEDVVDYDVCHVWARTEESAFSKVIATYRPKNDKLMVFRISLQKVTKFSEASLQGVIQ